jgi:putative OPT family oligopeptide transporter
LKKFAPNEDSMANSTVLVSEVEETPAEHKPYVPAETKLPELSVRAVILGAIFGILFGAVSVYLGLKVGLTVSASIPVAVLAITILKKLGKSSILENNIVQTVGSAGESIGAGVVFTMPAFIFLGFPLEISRIFFLALAGGCLGVLFMIPLRRDLIVREHGKLKYPEGTACAEVLIAGERGGSMAQNIFAGLGIGVVYRVIYGALHFWKETPEWRPKFFPGASVSAEISPELLGVGYIIGYRTASQMFAGGLLSWMVLIPFIKLFGAGLTSPMYPGIAPIAQMSLNEIWRAYVYYVGAGAVATGGLISLIKSLPIIFSSFGASFGEVKKMHRGEEEQKTRIDRDLPTSFVVFGSIFMVLLIWAILNFKINPGAWGGNIVSSILVVFLGFFFVTVSSRLVGLLGSSSNPISGMTIASLIATCLVFLTVGWTGHTYMAVALSIGAVVCIAAANAGATSQDLKTGYIVGSTPWRQQTALIIGVLASVAVVGYTMTWMNNTYTSIKQVNIPQFAAAQHQADLSRTANYQGKDYKLYTSIGDERIPDGDYYVDPADGQIKFQKAYGIGSLKLPAPKASIMAALIKGLLDRKLPWSLILLGVALALMAEVLGLQVLAFAVGVYLPVSTSATLFVGSVVRRFVMERTGMNEAEADAGRGTLYASGLIAGGALAGLALAALTAFQVDEAVAIGPRIIGWLAQSNVFGMVMFSGLVYTLYRYARNRSPM